MANTPRKIAFVLSATDHGALIVNRFDEHKISSDRAIGVGSQLLHTSAYEPSEVSTLRALLDLRRQHYGDGVIAVDCGANIGVHTVEWAKHMTGWGLVVGIEAQERIYYALAGNVALNNCFNARLVLAAVASQPGVMKIPNPNYFAPTSFGSLELKQRANPEFIGQDIDYSEAAMVDVRVVSIDAFNFSRLDLIKIDVEGMEFEALAGAIKSIERHRPILFVESLKVDKAQLRAFLEDLNYSVVPVGLNFLAIHKKDKCHASVQVVGAAAA